VSVSGAGNTIWSLRRLALTILDGDVIVVESKFFNSHHIIFAG